MKQEEEGISQDMIGQDRVLGYYTRSHASSRLGRGIYDDQEIPSVEGRISLKQTWRVVAPFVVQSRQYLDIAAWEFILHLTCLRLVCHPHQQATCRLCRQFQGSLEGHNEIVILRSRHGLDSTLEIVEFPFDEGLGIVEISDYVECLVICQSVVQRSDGLVSEELHKIPHTLRQTYLTLRTEIETDPCLLLIEKSRSLFEFSFDVLFECIGRLFPQLPDLIIGDSSNQLILLPLIKPSIRKNLNLVCTIPHFEMQDPLSCEGLLSSKCKLCVLDDNKVIV